LNAKLVSELREIAKLIGIADVEKLRKHELVTKIVEGEEEARNAASAAEAATEDAPDAGAERPRKRTRTVKSVEPVSVRNTRDDFPADSREPAAPVENRPEPVAASKPTNGSKMEGPTGSLDFDNVIV